MKSKLLLLAVSLVLWSMFAFPFAIVSFFDETIAFAVASLAAVYLYLMHRFTKGPASDLRYQSTTQNEGLVSLCPMLRQPFKTTIWGKNPHIQSTLMGLLRPPPELPFRREILQHGDGSTVAVDWLLHDADTRDATRPIVVVVPGLTGGSGTPYVRSFAKYCFEKHGWNVVIYNHRGCCGHNISTPALFQLGNHHDLKLMIDTAKAKFPLASLVAAGFSLGANLLTNYVCKVPKPDNPLLGAISMCQGYDGNSGVDHLQATSPFYSWVLVKKLTSLLIQHQSKFTGIQGVDVQKALSATSLKEFERHLSCPVFGYNSPDEYYIDQSCKWHLKNANVPLLLLNSLDDPLIPDFLMPREYWKDNENIIVLMVEHGGHLGFAEGFMTPNEFSWTDRLSSEYFSALLYRETQKNRSDAATAAN